MWVIHSPISLSELVLGVDFSFVISYVERRAFREALDLLLPSPPQNQMSLVQKKLIQKMGIGGDNLNWLEKLSKFLISVYGARLPTPKF
jgi:hypothetical protein